MTVNNEPRISRSLALLGSFRQTVADFAAREEELTKDITKRRYAAERKLQNALKDNAAAPNVNQCVSGSQVNRQIAGKLAAQPFEHVIESPCGQKWRMLTSRGVGSKPAKNMLG